MKTYEQALTEWSDNEIYYHAGFGPTKVSRGQMQDLFNVIVGKGMVYKQNNEFVSLSEGQNYFLVALAMLQRVQELYKAGMLEDLSPLSMVRLGTLEALYDIGITNAARMKPGWEKVS